jgi:hypothetical protein
MNRLSSICFRFVREQPTLTGRAAPRKVPMPLPKRTETSPVLLQISDNQQANRL